ncbi:cytochrome P450 [Mycena pura]|uniref:Cytochrome P450 n=1 Tax=Mycena pura TaxID=153505 RepID=A0AAD6V4E8_9AGAR|nr:cytochrome P450 [Mycena pura]
MGNPLFGQVFSILKNEPCISQRGWANKYGPVVRYMAQVGQECLIFLNPEALEKIMVKDWLEYPRPKFLREILGMAAGNGLLTMTGVAHKQLRKAMNPAFSIPNLIALTDMYYEPIEGLVEILKGQIKGEADPEAGKVFQMHRWMGEVTLDIICDTAFGYKLDCLHNPSTELAVAFEQQLSLQSAGDLAYLIAAISIPGVARLLASDWLYRHRTLVGKIPTLRSLELLVDSMHRIRKISREILRAKTTDLNVPPDDVSTKQNILSLMVRAQKAELDANPVAEVMSDMAMVEHAFTFLITGHEPIAMSLTWTLWLLANDPESQRRLREEVTPVYAANPRPDYRTLKSLEWLDCVINESLRVLPPVPQTIRVANKTDYIEGVLVPKGTLILIPIRVINTWKTVWGEDAEEFHPARWLNLPKAYNPAYSQFSFIAGPYGCFGKPMAVSEIKAVVAALIANFEFAPAYAGQVAHPTAALSTWPKDNMPLRVSRVKA